jgi:thymidylate synthase
MIENPELQYLELIKRIQTEGYSILPNKGPAKEVVNALITLPPDKCPLLSTRQIFYKGLVGELRGFLNGATTHEELQNYGCNFWGAWANKPIDYGRLLHNFNGINQLERVLSILRRRKTSRKIVISLWDPSSDTLQPPCVMHYQWLHDGITLKMIWSQRSADVMLGLASDMFSAWLFNQLIAKATGFTPGEVYIQIGSAHIYDIHDSESLLKRPVIYDNVEYQIEFNNLRDWNFQVTRYEHAEPIKYELLS